MFSKKFLLNLGIHLAIENRNIHNALRQVHLDLSSFSLNGFSISGLSTYLQTPELDFVVDLGECPLSAVPINHVFLTHAHGDHARCLMRHHSLRKMTGIARDAVYYIPENIAENAKAWIKAEAMFENVPEYKFRYPEIYPVAPNKKIHLAYRKDLALEAFHVDHSIPSMGCTLFRYKKKLRKELLSSTPEELIAKRASGEEITIDLYEPLITFMGDCKIESLTKRPEIFDSEYLVLECTFIDDEDEEMAHSKSHSHLNEIIKVLESMGEKMRCKNIILNHFSMKYSEKHILSAVEKKVPSFLKDKVKVLL